MWVYCSIHTDNVANNSWDTQYEYEWPAELKANGRAFASPSGFDPSSDVASYLINEAGQVLAVRLLSKSTGRNWSRPN